MIFFRVLSFVIKFIFCLLLDNSYLDSILSYYDAQLVYQPCCYFSVIVFICDVTRPIGHVSHSYCIGYFNCCCL